MPKRLHLMRALSFNDFSKFKIGAKVLDNFNRQTSLIVK